MDQLTTGAVAKLQPDLPEAPAGEAVAGRQADVLVIEAPDDLRDAGPVLRVAGEVDLVHLDNPLPRRRVDLVRWLADRRQPAGQERLAQPIGGDGQVRHGAEAAEALAEDAPAVDAELLPDQLGVPDDAVSAEVGHVRGLRVGRVARDVADGRRAAGPALVDQQHAVVGDRPLLPARGGRRRSCRLAAGTALLEDQVRPVPAIWRGDLAAEDRDPLAIGASVVERDDVLALDEDRAGDRVRVLGHRTLPSRRAAIDLSSRRARVSGLLVPVTWRACQLLFE